jgi:hypothetical protein
MKREVVTTELQFLPLKDTPLKNLAEKKGTLIVCFFLFVSLHFFVRE